MDRRELFKSFKKPFKKEEKKEIIIYPPYFLDIDDFAKSCVTCENKSCKTVCEENIIVIQDDGTPKIDFKLGGCTYCDECANVCEKGVLAIENKKNIDVEFKIDISKCSCVVCFKLYFLHVLFNTVKYVVFSTINHQACDPLPPIRFCTSLCFSTLQTGVIYFKWYGHYRILHFE